MSTIQKLLKLDDNTTDMINKVLFDQGVVMRKHDMSPDGKLTALVQDDGDMCLSIFDDENGSVASVEFTTPFSGGGQSENTWFALRLLFLAMTLDEIEREGHRSGGFPISDEVRGFIKESTPFSNVSCREDFERVCNEMYMTDLAKDGL